MKNLSKKRHDPLVWLETVLTLYMYPEERRRHDTSTELLAWDPPSLNTADPRIEWSACFWDACLLGDSPVGSEGWA